MPPPLELTLVLAATRDMGIGLNGTLPWTGLKKEMAYFARVTKRLPQGVCTHCRIVGSGHQTRWPSRFPPFRCLLSRDKFMDYVPDRQHTVSLTNIADGNEQP
jgi:dihydrofolate reductase